MGWEILVVPVFLLLFIVGFVGYKPRSIYNHKQHSHQEQKS